MDRKLLDYLPPVLRDVMEFQAINEANEPEIRLAWDALALVMANQFLETADEHGVSIWERELKIFPKDTDTLDVRKARIKAMWNLELPYTITWLRKWLAGVCGAAGYEASVTEYTLNIQLNFDAMPNMGRLAMDILQMLLAIRPSNIQLFMMGLLQPQGRIILGANTEFAAVMDIWPMVPRGIESIGSVTYGAASEMSRRIDILPMAAQSIETAGKTTTASALTYHSTMEIYPQGGMPNG